MPKLWLQNQMLHQDIIVSHVHGHRLVTSIRNHTSQPVSEPAYLDGDDVARGIDPICKNCDERHDDDHECGGDDPDRMYDEMHER